MRTAEFTVYLDQRTAAPLPCGKKAAGGACGAALLGVTLDIGRRGGGAEGFLLPVPGNHKAPSFARRAGYVALVALGAAVVSVIAANGLESRHGKHTHSRTRTDNSGQGWGLEQTESKR